MTDLGALPKTEPDISGQRADPDIEELVARYFRAPGPLPPPEIIAKYDEIVPGAAERLLKLATQHQETANRLGQQAAIRAHWSGLVAGCTSAIGLLVTGLLITLRDTHAGEVLGLFAPAAVGAAGAAILIIAVYFSRRGYGRRA
jgi:uncharacterized membrane protein